MYNRTRLSDLVETPKTNAQRQRERERERELSQSSQSPIMISHLPAIVPEQSPCVRQVEPFLFFSMWNCCYFHFIARFCSAPTSMQLDVYT